MSFMLGVFRALRIRKFYCKYARCDGLVFLVVRWQGFVR